MQDNKQGAVIAAHGAAARAGAEVLRAGGNAVDAAIATAASLCVVDPANCGIGGYGGFMVVHRPGAEATRIDFNTAVPATFDPQCLDDAPRAGRFVYGARSVSVPAVVPGWLAAHRAFGRVPWGDLLASAVKLAEEGTDVGPDLERSLAWAARSHGGLSAAFRSVFFHDGRPLRAGERLVQSDLARSLKHLAAAPDAWSGALVDALAACVGEAGGALAAADCRKVEAPVREAQRCAFGDALVHGPDPEASGFGVVASALAELQTRDLGDNRRVPYAQTLVAALNAAWARQRAQASLLIAVSRHTNHFCVADRDGLLVSCTFTHGPLWFGSGVMAPETGIVLNCGANLYARRHADGGLFPLTNLTPVIVTRANGSRHAMGSPGGIRIPAIVLQAVVDLVHYGLPLSESIGLPRVSVDFAGRAEAEPALTERLPDMKEIRTADYYGPASALSICATGEVLAARDPRFDSALAYA